MAFFPVASNNHTCKNCGHVQSISTNHDMGCIDYCKGCSWKPSWGTRAYHVGSHRQFVFSRAELFAMQYRDMQKGIHHLAIYSDREDAVKAHKAFKPHDVIQDNAVEYAFHDLKVTDIVEIDHREAEAEMLVRLTNGTETVVNIVNYNDAHDLY